MNVSAVEHCCFKCGRLFSLSLSLFLYTRIFFFLTHSFEIINMSTNATTRSVVTDYFEWRLKNKNIKNNLLYNIIHKIAYYYEINYYSQQPTIFNYHISSLSLINLENFHREIGKELFYDGIITWSRILTFISFSAILAEHIIHY